MAASGIRKGALQRLGIEVKCYLGDPRTATMAAEKGYIVKYGSCSLVLFLLCFFFLCLYTLGIVLMTVFYRLCLW